MTDLTRPAVSFPKASHGDSAPSRLHAATILGAGSWGTALAASLGAAGHAVTLWARRPEAAEAIAAARRNADYLPGALLADSVAVTSDLERALSASDLWVFAVPSQTVRALAAATRPHRRRGLTLLSVAKGIEQETLLTTSAVLRDVLPEVEAGRVGVLYGPSHAEEVAESHPTSVVVSMPEVETGERVQALFMTPALRVYLNPDLVGVEVAGSVKNVMALAAGMSDGLNLGDNAKAALVTRGLAEITRLGLAMGADPHTFAGLAGLGDLVVTCFSRHSRNRRFGEQVGSGMSLEEARASSRMVVEGVWTTRSVRALARRHGIEMPITEAVYRILFEGLEPGQAVRDLMTREARREAAHLALASDGTEA